MLQGRENSDQKKSRMTCLFIGEKENPDVSDRAVNYLFVLKFKS